MVHPDEYFWKPGWEQPERADAKVLRWIWRYPPDSRPRLDAALDRHPHPDIVELRTRAEMSEFLGALPH